jgi:cold-inducible RNA-binding protein
MKNLFVGNLSFRTTETELRALFEPFGQIARIHIATDRDTGRSRGFAFVDMPNDEEATRAMTALNGKDLDGRPLKVNEARPKPERTQRRRRRRRTPGTRRVSRVSGRKARTALVSGGLRQSFRGPDAKRVRSGLLSAT